MLLVSILCFFLIFAYFSWFVLSFFYTLSITDIGIIIIDYNSIIINENFVHNA